MNCIEGLKLVESNLIDLVMTDIPYNISQKKTLDRTKLDSKKWHREGERSKTLNFNYGEWDFFDDNIEYFEFIKEVFTEVYRTMKDSASMYMWLPKSEVSFIEYVLKDIGFHVRSTLVWCKTNPTPNIMNIGYMSSTEFCTYATKLPGGKHYWDKSRGNRLSYWIKPICQGNERTEHPTQKRLDIAEDMILQSCKKGGVLLDPFCGSGTFPVAGRRCGLNFIAFEQDAKFYEIAKNRINAEINQMNIWDYIK